MKSGKDSVILLEALRVLPIEYKDGKTKRREKRAKKRK